MLPDKHTFYCLAVAAATIVAAPSASYSQTATNLVCNKCVGTSDIAKGAIVTSRLKGGAVTAGKLRDEAVVTAKLAKAAVTSAKIRGGAVTRAKLKNGAVSLSKLSAALQAAIAKIDQQATTIAALQSTVGSLQSTVNGHGNILTYFSVSDVEDPNDSDTSYPTVLITGANLQIVNGDGAVNNSLNGTGNLIVGYNHEFGAILDGEYAAQVGMVCDDPADTNQTDCENNGGTWASTHRGGSHNLIVGTGHSYASQGAIVAGMANRSLAEGASVTGGYHSFASGWIASVSGGRENRASGIYASISGGSEGNASGFYASISGGNENTASGTGASVSGGASGSAPGSDDWAAGSLWEDN